MKDKQKYMLMFSLIASIFIFLGCTANKDVNNETISENRNSIFDESIGKISAWAAYWNLDVDEEVSILGSQLGSVSYFEAYFDNKYEIIIPDELLKYFNETKSENYEKYITFVNDVKKDDNKFSLKDINLLKEILSDSELQNKYVNDITSIAINNGFDGIEIDFEGIKNNIELWNKYIEFINKLYYYCEKSNLKLRIILEPNTPIEDINFGEGPVYVMMCYNLHGSSTKPGEKANPEFINNLIDKMEKVPGTKDFAVASGGFDWDENGKTTSVDEKKAEELLEKYKSEKKRDSTSGCIYFEYIDESNIEHEVWYADKDTLNKWMKVISERGHKVSLWRLGGNKF